MTNLAVGMLELRAECVDSGNGRVYLIVVSGAEPSGNVGFNCNTVVVPHDGSPAGLTTITSLAAQALTYCQAHNGTPPPGYFVIGDGDWFEAVIVWHGRREATSSFRLGRRK